MDIPLEQIIDLLSKYKYILLFPIAEIEGPIITVIAGFLSSLGYMNIFLAFIIVVIGDLSGDVIYYLIGRYGRKGFIDKWGRFIGITPKRINRLEKKFKKNVAKTLIFGKVAHGMGTFFILGAGIARVPFNKFIWISFFATFLKSLILILVGFYFGQAYVQIGSYLDYTALAGIVLGFVFLIIYFIFERRADKLAE